MFTKEQKIVSLIRNAVLKTPLPENFPTSFSEEEIGELYQIAKRHDLAHLVAFALKNNRIGLPKTAEALFQKQLFGAVFRCEKMQYELKRISGLLEKEKIPFVPLKGSILRTYYPEIWMRTSSDIDLFVRESDLQRLSELITESAGYTAEGQWNGERSFFSPDGIHLEVHFYDDADEEEGLIFREIWDHVSPSEGFEYRMQMEWEYFYIHHVLHMAKHFSHGGCGIRPFLDLILMRNQIELDPEKKREYLEKFNLAPFAVASEKLASVWFGTDSHSPLTEQMEDYLFGAGIYGSIENKVALEKSGKGKQLSGFFAHVWLSYDDIKHQFPAMIRHKWLYPFCQFRRWFRLIFCGGLKRSFSFLHHNLNMSSEKVEKVSQLMDELNLS